MSRTIILIAYIESGIWNNSRIVRLCQAPEDPYHHLQHESMASPIVTFIRVWFPVFYQGESSIAGSSDIPGLQDDSRKGDKNECIAL
jgi:hypothetical protein